MYSRPQILPQEGSGNYHYYLESLLLSLLPWLLLSLGTPCCLLRTSEQELECMVGVLPLHFLVSVPVLVHCRDCLNPANVEVHDYSGVYKCHSVPEWRVGQV